MRARDLFDLLRAAVRASDWPDADRRHALAELQRLEREDQARELQPIVFRESARPGHWEIGSGDDVREARANTLGIRAAHRALTGEHVACCDLAPDGDNPGKVAGRAVRVQAVKWAERHGCARLARELLRIRVRGELLVYEPGPDRPPLVLW